MSSNNGTKTASGLEPRVYFGHIISPKSSEQYDEFEHGAMVVDGAGKIVAVCKRENLSDHHSQLPAVDFGRKLLIPGMIDLHAHLVQLAQTARAGDTLLGWLEKYIFVEEQRFADLEHARKLSNWFFSEMAANGTTLASVFTSIHASATDIAFETAERIGVRVIMGKVMMDRNSPPELTEDTNESLSESERLCKKWHGRDDGRLMYAYTPRFACTSTSELMRGAARLWKQTPGAYMQTHLSENLDEIEWVKQLFPDSKDYLDAYGSHGLTGTNSIFAHAIHLTDREFQALAKDDCALAHCPSSNFFLKSGVFPLERIKKAGIKFGLGSDIAAGPEMCIFNVMKDAAYIQPDMWIKPAELLYFATLAGAQAVNLQDKVGSLEVGKEADFIVVDPTAKTGVPADILEQPSENILSSLVYVGDDRMVKATYVRGRAIYRSAELDTTPSKAAQSRV
jgi:guanine deaminase